MLDILQDWIGGVALAVTTAIAAWLGKLSSTVHRHSTKLAVHEAKIDDIPNGLRAITAEIKGLREDGKTRSAELYRHMDDMRREIKDDLKGKQDRT